jgi:hypothetical protein
VSVTYVEPLAEARSTPAWRGGEVHAQPSSGDAALQGAAARPLQRAQARGGAAAAGARGHAGVDWRAALITQRCARSIQRRSTRVTRSRLVLSKLRVCANATSARPASSDVNDASERPHRKAEDPDTPYTGGAIRWHRGCSMLNHDEQRSHPDKHPPSSTPFGGG